ncbi:hypothetical protein TRL7639_03682 [Falsiruegeria litorea R37]|uniref:Carboxymuconolactone decarboxylase family protein n=1 Tax=Falsiruegeria litorea R37 TaxID=1200284 RepID=A0A1Y5TJ32_9RHOB|nr:hypothetical protein [Falsiruegeria litorea]SLN65302.1 hypothetical protein TRL7639_03682 [Falsiruegeria litorea R37]
MTQRIPSVDTDSPEQAAVQRRVAKVWGGKLNISDAMAHNPAVLDGVLSLWAALDQSGLSAEDREVICVDMAVQNGCHY